MFVSYNFSVPMVKRNKIHFAVVVGTKTTRWTRDPGVGDNSRLVWNTKWFNITRQIECVHRHHTQPSLEVHHHLTIVILISSIFISQILQWSLVIRLLKNFEYYIVNNFYLGSRTRNQNGAPKYHPVIHLIPIGDESMVIIPHIYPILASRTSMPKSRQ